jgi:cytochrome c peroxidase
VRSTLLVAGVVLAALVNGCDSPAGTRHTWQLPPGFPPPLVPESNPLTLEKIELGRHLFYDRRLSGNGTQSCADCHRQSSAFSEAAATATGSTGEEHRRNTMALVNVAYNSTYTWAHPGITTLERHVLIPLFGDAPVEMGAAGREQEILERLGEDERYRELFRRAYPREPDPIDLDNVVKAVTSFVRTLVSFGSPFDRYAYFGEDEALSESQIRGMNLFMSERLECAHCHAGFNFSQFVTHENLNPLERTFHVTGLYNVGERGAAGLDRGLFEATGEPLDRDRFKAPTLRNIEHSAPYMHDGSLASLGDVVDFYAAGGREIPAGPYRGDGRAHPGKSPFVVGFELTAQEREDLLGFLRGLSDDAYLSDPAFADPFAR